MHLYSLINDNEYEHKMERRAQQMLSWPRNAAKSNFCFRSFEWVVALFNAFFSVKGEYRRKLCVWYIAKN